MADLQSADSPAAQVIAIHSMKNPDMAMLRGGRGGYPVRVDRCALLVDRRRDLSWRFALHFFA